MNLHEKLNSESHLISRNKNGNIDTVLVSKEVILETSVGKVIPRYTLDDEGRKKEAPVKFFKTGELKSLPLEERTEIHTSVGDIKSELLIFHKNGALARTFPLNGQVSGFWTEQDEFKLTQAIEIPTSIGILKVKPIYVQFYDTGELDSILFWPSEKVKINTPVGEVLIHKGICFHKNGAIKGFEPTKQITIESPIGRINAFDPDPVGMHAENHSLNFYDDGSIQSIITSSSRIVLREEGAKTQNFEPKLVESYCNENAFFVAPLKVSFEDDFVSFMNANECAVKLPKSLNYQVLDYIPMKPISCFGCS